MSQAKKPQPDSSHDSVEVAAPTSHDSSSDSSDDDSFLYLFLCELTYAIQVCIKAVAHHNIADKLQPGERD